MAVVFSSWSESDDMAYNSDNAMSVYFKIIIYSCAGGLTMHKHELIMCLPINGSWASAHKIIICSYTGLMTTVGGAGVVCPVRLGVGPAASLKVSWHHAFYNCTLASGKYVCMYSCHVL